MIGSDADRPGVHERPLFPRPAVGDARPRSRRSDQDGSVPYNAANSGGSNLGPTSKALIDRVKGDVDKLKAGESVGARSRSTW